NWTTFTVGGALDVSSSGGTLTIGSATSGGGQTLAALGDLVFTHLTTMGIPGDPGNVDLTSTAGGIRGDAIGANGGVTIDAFGAIAIASLHARGGVNLSSQTALSLPAVTTGSGSVFDSPIINIGTIRPDAGVVGPFVLGFTGYRGAVGSELNVSVDGAPYVILSELREDNAQIATDAKAFAIDAGYIVDVLGLTTPYENLLMNNQTSRPVIGPDVQLFVPTYSFTLAQNIFLTTTSAFVVRYDGVGEIDDRPPGYGIFGASFVRDFDRQARDGDIPLILTTDEMGLPPSWRHAVWPNPIFFGSPAQSATPGVPAVNLGGALTVGEEIWQLANDNGGLEIVVRRRNRR
ncbi:MAG TPA: hypothetical protein VKU03_05100, partial [Roseiarcus sp.]|nr:hypothetical protein [Roseiarcus sp.]